MMTQHRKVRIGPNGLALPGLLVGVLILCCGCGSGTSVPPPPPDFNLSVNPSAVSVTVGTISPAVTITVAAQNHFAETVNIAINGLPPEAFSSPPVPLAIAPTGTQQVTFFIPPSAATGSLSLEFDATGGGVSHSSSLSVTVSPVSDTARLQETSGQVAAGTVEIQGLSAGPFTPDYWQKNTLNWVPDVRVPMLLPQVTGPFQNIYAPWALEQAGGWRLFYGGWDGSDSPNDRVYSVTTSDFLSFENRMLVIDHGTFQHVNNVNVQQSADGSLHMICTGGPWDSQNNFILYFSSPDGTRWNGTPEPYAAQQSDSIVVQGYAGFSTGNFNGSNVLFQDNGTWVLYFVDDNHQEQVYRATAVTLPNFQLQGTALTTEHGVNDVKKFAVGGMNWYVMGLLLNGQTLWYSLSNDGVTFQPEQTLINQLYVQDFNMVSLGFVVSGNRLLGILYGADQGTPSGDLTGNAIFGRWLQKKVVITDSSGAQYVAQGSYGPDRQWFQAPPSGNLQGTMVVYAEDGVTPIGSSFVTLTSGKAYTLVLK